MKTVNRIKELIVELVSDLTSNLVNGRIGFFSRRFYGVTDGAWNQFAFINDIPNIGTALGQQAEINSNIFLTDNHSLQTLIITASCTITVPYNLIDGFQISGYVKTGQTLTFANSGGTTFVGNNSVITVAEKQTFSLVKINGTTEFILKL